jgi:hypothetical protein
MLWLRIISLYGSSDRGTWRGGGAPSLGALKVYERKALGTGISPYGDSVGQPVVGSATRTFEIWVKGPPEVEHLSLWELCEGNLEGGLPCWGPWRIGR